MDMIAEHLARLAAEFHGVAKAVGATATAGVYVAGPCPEWALGLPVVRTFTTCQGGAVHDFCESRRVSANLTVIVSRPATAEEVAGCRRHGWDCTATGGGARP